MRLTHIAVALAALALAACETVPAPAASAPTFGGTPPQGFGADETVTLAAATLAVEGPPGAPTEPLIVPAGDYPVRRVAADRIRIGFTVAIGPDGESLPPPVVYETMPTVRVGGTDDKLVAVIVAARFCGLPQPAADELYRWGDEPVTRSDDSGEFQFVHLC